MDVNGAKALRTRIQQVEHWRLATAVREGRQSASDPDVAELVELGPGVRRYADGLEKWLVDGRWEAVAADRVRGPASIAADREGEPGGSRGLRAP